jgi:phage-related protein
MNLVEFVGDSLDRLKAFPAGPRRRCGYQISRVQAGLMPDDWKPMASVGPGVQEIRVRNAAGACRVIYMAKFADAIYILHCFDKRPSARQRRTSIWRPSATRN